MRVIRLEQPDSNRGVFGDASGWYLYEIHEGTHHFDYYEGESPSCMRRNFGWEDVRFGCASIDQLYTYFSNDVVEHLLEQYRARIVEYYVPQEYVRHCENGTQVIFDITKATKIGGKDADTRSCGISGSDSSDCDMLSDWAA